jgi:predicted nucleic acid-binding protein
MAGVIVDTSAWIEFFRHGKGKISDQIAHLIEEDQACLTGPIIAELLQGVRNVKEAERLRGLLQSLPYLEVLHTDWEAAGQTLQALRLKGVTLSLTDALISACAVRHGVPVLTLDKDFDSLPAKHGSGS